VPADYLRRQTLKNAERFITPELKAFEDKVLSARRRALAREKLLYEQLLDALIAGSAGCSAAPPPSRSSTCSRRWPSARHAGLLPAAPELAEPVSRSRRAPPGGGTRLSESPSCQRPRARRPAAHADHHRPEHGRQIDLHAPGRR
jgi:hypothetical protein